MVKTKQRAAVTFRGTSAVVPQYRFTSSPINTSTHSKIPIILSFQSIKRKIKKMAESSKKSSFEEFRHWIVEHKLRAVGCLWLSGVTGSIAYNWSQPNMKTSVKLIHARLHAQALTLAALAGAAVVEYYDHKSGEKSERYAKFLPPPPPQTHNHKD